MLERAYSSRPPVSHLVLALAVAQFAVADFANAFVPFQRWTQTASGTTGVNGDPITLTWSFVPDNTLLTGQNTSSLISFLDETFGAGPGGAELSLRPWFSHFDASFGRWGELGGITFLYEPFDDGAPHGSSPGQLGVRGDIRLGGMPIDGPSGTLATSQYPNASDLVLDTADGAFFANPASNYLRLRNILMHEIGHAIGLQHVVSSDANFLLEPSLNLSFDGPQLDDIRGLHYYYGDALEKTNGGLGNNTPAHAFDLGLIADGATRRIGAGAGTGTAVAAGETDFVSITHWYDGDYYSFAIAQPTEVNILLTPRGGVFHQGLQGSEQTLFNANAGGNLALAVVDSDGGFLRYIDAQPAGGIESLTNFTLPAAGQYYVRVSGGSTTVQLYQLEIAVVSSLTALAGDFNSDGTVDAADFIIWRKTFGQSGTALAADANGDGTVNDTDYQIWRTNFGNRAAGGAAAVVSLVPEPSVLMLVALSSLLWPRRRARY